MQKYTDCFLYFQANCSRSRIVCFLTKMFHNSNKTWHIIQVRSPSTITQKFIYEFNLVTSTPKICENMAVKIFPVHVGFGLKFSLSIIGEYFNLKTEHCILTHEYEVTT